MLNILIFLSISQVLTDIDPCYPTGGPCKKYEDCPKGWRCIDDTPDPINPENVDGICVGNKRIKDCKIPGASNQWMCPKKRPNLNVSIVF